MRMLAALLLLTSGCLKGWPVAALYACGDAGVCSEGLQCDDGVCCRLGGSPACPTLPFEGRCPNGSPRNYFRDQDGDGFGAGVGDFKCALPASGWSSKEGDCDDRVSSVFPQGQEVCDGLDNNCNGEVDEGLDNRNLEGFPDVDGDGYGVLEGGIAGKICALPRGFAPVAGDCQPSDPKVSPSQPERCNTIDDNCNGLVDEAPVFFPGPDGKESSRVACAGTGRGVCQAAHLTCSGVVGAKAPVCTADFQPSAERCRDALDSDCDGDPDNQPGCGGPSAFTQAIGRVRASSATVVGGLSALSKTRCLEGTSTSGSAWVNPVWISSLPVYTGGLRTTNQVQVWSLEAPVGESWDLSKDKLILQLPLEVSSVGDVDAGVAFWSNGGLQPVIQLCDASGTLLRQYQPVSAAVGFGTQGRHVALPTVLLNGSDAGFTVSNMGNIDTVTKVNVLIAPQNVSQQNFQLTVLVRFSADAGFWEAP